MEAIPAPRPELMQQRSAVVENMFLRNQDIAPVAQPTHEALQNQRDWREWQNGIVPPQEWDNFTNALNALRRIDDQGGPRSAAEQRFVDDHGRHLRQTARTVWHSAEAAQFRQHDMDLRGERLDLSVPEHEGVEMRAGYQEARRMVAAGTEIVSRLMQARDAGGNFDFRSPVFARACKEGTAFSRTVAIGARGAVEHVQRAADVMKMRYPDRADQIQTGVNAWAQSEVEVATKVPPVEQLTLTQEDAVKMMDEYVGSLFTNDRIDPQMREKLVNRMRTEVGLVPMKEKDGATKLQVMKGSLAERFVSGRTMFTKAKEAFEATATRIEQTGDVREACTMLAHGLDAKKWGDTYLGAEDQVLARANKVWLEVQKQEQMYREKNNIPATQQGWEQRLQRIDHRLATIQQIEDFFSGNSRDIAPVRHRNTQRNGLARLMHPLLLKIFNVDDTVRQEAQQQADRYRQANLARERVRQQAAREKLEAQRRLSQAVQARQQAAPTQNVHQGP